MPEQTQLEHHTLFGDRFTVRCALTVDAPADGGQEAAEGPRTIEAVLAEYGKTVHPTSYFPAVRLAAGALTLPEDPNDVKLLRDHDPSRVIGAMTGASDMDTAPRARFRLARTADAADALSLVDRGFARRHGNSEGTVIGDSDELGGNDAPIASVICGLHKHGVASGRQTCDF